MKKTLSFFGSCSARSEQVLVSDRIATPFVMDRIQAEFADGCNDLLQVKVFTSNSPTDPSSGEPDGVSILSEYGQVDYVVGDGMNKDFHHNFRVAEGGTWLKVYANNTDFFDHDVIVLITIDIELRKESN